MKDFFINVEFGETRVAIVKNKKLNDYHVERSSDKGIFGNVYKGKVQTVIPGIQAAFVDLGLKMNGFLYISEITHRIYQYEDILDGKKVIPSKVKNKRKNANGDITKLLKKGQDILVQVVREPINTKGPRLTTHISLPGKYLVLMPFDSHIGISNRIKNTSKKKYLKKIVSNLKVPKNSGLIFRTSAKYATKNEIISEYKYLEKQWHKIKKKTEVSKSPCLIYEERGLVLRVMRDMLSDKVNKVFIDSKIEYKRCVHFLKKFSSSFKNKIQYYKKDNPIFENFGIQKEIDKIYKRKVKLKSGGYIIIEPTESLVSIDVNSGGYVGKKNLEDTAFFVNMQAAEEIIKQIWLRDLGGIIIIDFIDMNKSNHVKRLLSNIKKMLKKDKAEVDFWYSSKAGLVEMTRQRSKKSLKSVSYKECAYCNGKGMVKSPGTVGIQTIRKIKKFTRKRKCKEITVKLHPEVVNFLLANNKVMLDEVRYKNKVDIFLKKIPQFHVEQVEFV